MGIINVEEAEPDFRKKKQYLNMAAITQVIKREVCAAIDARLPFSSPSKLPTLIKVRVEKKMQDTGQNKYLTAVATLSAKGAW